MISIIVAVDLNGAIGKQNALPWRLPADLKRFKEITMGHPVVMGRKTYESIGKPLPGRENIVITRNADAKIPGVQVVNSVEKAFKVAPQNTGEVFLIGGAEIYKQALPLVDKLYVTKVFTKVDGADAFFPEISTKEWNRISEEEFSADEKNPFSYSYLTFIRKS